MAKPLRWTLIALGAALAGLAALILGISIARPEPRHWDDSAAPAMQPDNILALIAMVGGGFVLLLALVLGSLALMFTLRRRRLRSLRGVVAAWRVPPADWDAFRAGEPARQPVPSLCNRVSLADEAPAAGMEIFVGETAIAVGDGCYGLGAGSVRMRSKWLADLRWIDPQTDGPGGLEFIEYTFSPNKGFLLFVSRLPVPASARGDAWRAFEHFQAIIVPEKRASVRKVFAAELAAATGDAGAIPMVEEKDRRSLRRQGQSALFGAAVAFAFWGWQMSRPDHGPIAAFIPLVLIPFALVGIILIVQGSRRRG